MPFFAKFLGCQSYEQNRANVRSETLTKLGAACIVVSGGDDMSTEYLPRIADNKLELQLAASGAVLIIGPKWCGKTRTAAEKANSTLYARS